MRLCGLWAISAGFDPVSAHLCMTWLLVTVSKPLTFLTTFHRLVIVCQAQLQEGQSLYLWACTSWQPLVDTLQGTFTIYVE